MKKRKLKSFVLPTLYLMIMASIFVGITFLNKALNRENYDNYNFVMSAFKSNIVSVVNETNDEVISPVDNAAVEISKGFYDMNSDTDSQQKALIYYEKTYMENTGILYTSDEKFDCLAVMDGTIKNIKEDEILGKVVEVENTNRVNTIYYSLENVNFSVGDTIKQGDIIGTSGPNKLENEKSNCLLFEVYIDGNLKNPSEFFNTKISELN